MSRKARLDRYAMVSSRLASVSDRRLMALLGEGVLSGAGIGGTTASLTVEGVPVFVKMVPLTNLERLPEHIGSTANLFNLPTFYQYGIGSAGLGVWREVAAHIMTTGWVLEKRYQGFPLLYHWRVLPQPPAPIEPVELERQVVHWEDSSAVRARLTAINESSASVVLFMERIPRTVHSWLTEQTAAGEWAASAAYNLVDQNLQAGVTFMQSQGLVHFDAHFLNLLTDGRRLYFADFGLATCAQFDLDAAESAFFHQHSAYDRCYTATHLTHWLLSNLLPIPWEDCDEYIRNNPDGGGYAALPAAAAAIVARYKRIAIIMGRFYRELRTTGLSTPYPYEGLRQAGDGWVHS